MFKSLLVEANTEKTIKWKNWEMVVYGNNGFFFEVVLSDIRFLKRFVN